MATNSDSVSSYEGQAQQLRRGIGAELSRLAASEHLSDTLQHMRRMEVYTSANPSAIDSQIEIDWSMRVLLIDFMIEAHAFFRLSPETLFLSINLLDRYSSTEVVRRKEYQLLGCTALFVAAKYADQKDRCPTTKELSFVCCHSFEPWDIVEMEAKLLASIDWTVGNPTVIPFLDFMILEGGDGRETAHMSVYLCEISLYHEESISVKPSAMARICLEFARSIISDPEAIRRLDRSEARILGRLLRHFRQPSPTLARKYAKPHLSSVSRRLGRYVSSGRDWLAIERAVDFRAGTTED